MWIAGVPLRHGTAVRLFLAGCLGTMILGAAYMFYTTARYTILRAYKPVILQVAKENRRRSNGRRLLRTRRLV